MAHSSSYPASRANWRIALRLGGFTRRRGSKASAISFETSGARWLLLSSLYGLVEPDAEIAPYDHTLNSLGVADRQAWAKKVLEKLLPEAADFRRIVIFAGVRYREFLIRPLEQRGKIVDIPMENLTRGEQLAWLNQHR